MSLRHYDPAGHARCNPQLIYVHMNNATVKKRFGFFARAMHVLPPNYKRRPPKAFYFNSLFDSKIYKWRSFAKFKCVLDRLRTENKGAHCCTLDGDIFFFSECAGSNVENKRLISWGFCFWFVLARYPGVGQGDEHLNDMHG